MSNGDSEARSDMSSTPIVMSVDTFSGRYKDDADERWLDEVVDLVQDLREAVGGVQRRHDIQTGWKGATADTIIIALGSAGAFQSAVAVFKGWLSRDRSRRLRIRVDDHVVELDGDSLDDRTLREVAVIIARRLPVT